MNPYAPSELPLADLDYRRLLPLVGAANRGLSRYDGLLQGIVNPAVMLSPLTIEEATLSSVLKARRPRWMMFMNMRPGWQDPRRLMMFRK